MTSGPVCVDCEKREATVHLPEGRNLCRECWRALKSLREYVVTETAKRRRG